MSEDVKILRKWVQDRSPRHFEGCICGECEYAGWVIDALDRIEGQAAKMESSLRNVSMLARRQVRKSREDAWLHILRFCEEAGIVANILRTDGTNNAPPTPAGGGALPTPDMLAAKMLPVPVSKGSGVVNQAVPSDTTKCAVCGGPKYLHRAEISAHHSECTLEQFRPVESAANQARECESCKARKALAEFLRLAELADVPGYVYDDHQAKCCECGVAAGTISDINHEADCYMRGVELARAALSTPCPCTELRAEVERLKAETDYIGAKATAEWAQSVIDELRAEHAAMEAEIGTIQAMLRVKDQHAAFAGQELATAQERIKALEDGLVEVQSCPSGRSKTWPEIDAIISALLAPAKEGEK